MDEWVGMGRRMVLHIRCRLRLTGQMDSIPLLHTLTGSTCLVRHDEHVKLPSWR
jgi:hypothetical protein